MDSPLLLSFYLLYFFFFIYLPPSSLQPCADSTPHRHAHLPTRRPPAHLYPHTTLPTHPPTAQAIAVVGKARADALTHSLIDFLMGETDGLPKDPNYIFRLYMALGNYAQVRAREGRRLRRAAPAPRRASRAGTHGPPGRRLTPAPLIREQAASTAVIIARQEQVCCRLPARGLSLEPAAPLLQRRPACAQTRLPAFPSAPPLVGAAVDFPLPSPTSHSPRFLPPPRSRNPSSLHPYASFKPSPPPSTIDHRPSPSTPCKPPLQPDPPHFAGAGQLPRGAPAPIRHARRAAGAAHRRLAGPRQRAHAAALVRA